MHVVDEHSQRFLSGPAQTLLHSEIARVGGAPPAHRSFVPPAPTKCSLQNVMAPAARKLSSLAVSLPSHSRVLRYMATRVLIVIALRKRMDDSMHCVDAVGADSEAF